MPWKFRQFSKAFSIISVPILNYFCPLTRAFDDRTMLVAHRLMPGQRIAIHNDHLTGGETHRLTIQLNRGLRDEDGGFFMLFNSSDPKDIHRIIRPVTGSGIGFEIGRNSNHAVSRLHGGERYTLVYSFFAQAYARWNSGSG